MLAMWVLLSIYKFWPCIKVAGEIVIESWTKVVLLLRLKRVCFPATLLSPRASITPNYSGENELRNGDCITLFL